MKVAPPIGAGYPAFLTVFHLPGLRLAEPPIMNVGGVWLREIAWEDWVILENTDLAERLYGQYERERPVFCSINLEDFVGSLEEALVLRNTCESNLQLLVAALRLHKAGPVIDPRESVRYVRVKECNMREPGLYRHRLFECGTDHYQVARADLADIDLLHNDLRVFATTPDAGVALALRHFRWSYGYSLTASQRLAFLFTTLEAIYGEYRMANRPEPRISLGTVASVVSRTKNSAALGSFLDDRRRGRGLRNYVAHGAMGAPPMPIEQAMPILEEAVRDGLRALVQFAVRKGGLAKKLEEIAHGLSSAEPKEAFQRLLCYAANGAQNAVELLRPTTPAIS